MKSSVWGKGRNEGRNKGPFHPAAANVNMKGKKVQQQLCCCCFCIDMRDKMLKKEHMKEIKRGISNEKD